MPTTTNLGIVTPASSDYVTNGAVAMQTMADDIDAYFGAPSTYTPTTTNISGGTVSGRYTRMGKFGFIQISVTAGTATAANSISFTVPSGWTNAAYTQIVPARNGNAIVSAAASASGTTIVVWADAAGNNFGAGASLTGIRVNGWIWLS